MLDVFAPYQHKWARYFEMDRDKDMCKNPFNV